MRKCGNVKTCEGSTFPHSSIPTFPPRRRAAEKARSASIIRRDLLPLPVAGQK